MRKFDYIFILLIIASGLQHITIGTFKINQLFGWLALFTVSVALFNIFKNKKTISSLIFTMIIFRISAIVKPEFFLFYDIINNLLFFLAGLFIFTFRERIFFKQLLFIAIICAPIMILQLAGVPWVHYHTYGQDLALSNGFINTIFNPGPFNNITHFQIRPPAILASNQPMGLLLVFFVTYFLFHFRQLKWYHYLLISLTIVLSTSYYVYISSILLFVSFLFLKSLYFKKRKIKVIVSILFATLLFSFIFPGISDRLWDKYDIMNKVWVRLVDLQMAGINVFKISYFSDIQSILAESRYNQISAFYYNVIEPGDYKTYSIVSYMYKNLLIGIILLIFFSFFLIKIIKTNNSLKYAKLFTVLTLSSFIIVNPNFDMSIFCFLLAFPTISLLPDFYIKYGK